MKRDFHIGPGAASLILIIVILSLSALSILALTTARNDERLSVRAANVTEAISELNNSAEKTLAALDALFVRARESAEDDTEYLKIIESNLSNDRLLEGNCVSWVEKDKDGHMLNCSVEILSLDNDKRFVWTEHRLGSEFAEMELEDTWN